MKKVVLEIISFAIAIALIVGVVIVIANQGHATGVSAKDRYDTTDTTITNLATPVQ